MRIAYIIENFPSPTEYFILNEIKELEKAGFHITVFVLRKQEQFKLLLENHHLEARIFYLPKVFFILPLSTLSFLIPPRKIPHLYGNESISFARLSSYFKLFRNLSIAWYFARKEKGFDHIHAHFAFIAADIAFSLSGILKVPYSFTAHAKDIYTNTVKIKQHISFAEFLVTCTQYNAAYLNKLTDHKFQRKIVHVYHGINTCNKDRNNVIKDSKKIKILSVGRLVEKKGHIYLLKAIRILVKEGFRIDCIIIGEGKLKSEFQKYIKANELDDCVQIIPFLPQNFIFDYYIQADIFVLPCIVAENGDRDGLPNVILEALSRYLPVISTPISAIPEAIIHGETGILVQPKDGKAIAESIKNLVRDESLRADITKNAYELVAGKFQLKSCTRELADVFYTHISKSSGEKN